MEWKMYLLCGCLLLATLHLQSSAAHPIAEPDTDSELDSFKGILGRLEEKLSLLEALDGGPGSPEGNPEDWPQQMPTPEENGAPASNTAPFRRFSLKGLRSIQSPKMMGGAGCFGRRIDRINSLSGMGCSGFRRN